MPTRLILSIGILSLTTAPVIADWPEFRGPDGNGAVTRTTTTDPARLPVHWSESNNIRWKTAIPHKGWSTPVVMNGQIWLTTATVEGHDFYALCLDAASGEILCNKTVFHCDDPDPLGNDLNCYASPSPTIDRGRVYVHFGSYGTACLDTRTFEVVWKRNDLPCRHYRGPGSSVILFEDLLMLTMDGVDVQYIAALDKRSGETVWRTDRTADWNDLDLDGNPQAGGDLRKAYYTPLIVRRGGESQLISPGAKAVYGYDPRTGRELWKVSHSAFSGASRPLHRDGLVYVPSGSGTVGVMAIDISGRGDLTDSNVRWRLTRGAPRMPSGVLVEDLLFLVTDGGIGSCVESSTGKQLWQERLGTSSAASLLHAGDRIYSFDQNGRTTVFKPNRVFEVIARNELEAGFMASPAVVDNAFILRTMTHLYRIENPSEPGS